MKQTAGTTRSTHQDARPAEGWWVPLWRFFIHSTLGTGIFVVIFAPAVGLQWGMHKMEASVRIDPWLSYAAKTGEVTLVVVDIILYVVFLLKTGWRAAKEF